MNQVKKTTVAVRDDGRQIFLILSSDTFAPTTWGFTAAQLRKLRGRIDRALTDAKALSTKRRRGG